MKRKKTKSNQALALFLCGALLVFSIGLVLARGSGGSEPYKTRDLILTQGDSDYELTSGISYDTSQYSLSVTDEGGFDINTPGTYTVSYRLTPVTGPSISKPPTDTGGAAGGGEPSSPPASGPVQPDSPAVQNPNDSSGQNPDTPGDTPDSKPGESVKPEEPKPAEPAPSPSPTPAPNPTPAPKPDTDSAPSPDSPSKPDGGQKPAPKPDADSAPAPESPSEPEPASKPNGDAASGDTAAPNVTLDSGSASSQTDPNSNSRWETAQASRSGISQTALAAIDAQESFSLSQYSLAGISGHRTGAVSSNPLLIGDASTTDGAKTKPDADKPASGGGNTKPDTDKPAAGGGTKPEGNKPSSGDSASKPEGDKPASGGGSSAKPDADKPATGDSDAKPDVDQPATDKPVSNPDTDKPVPEAPSVTPEPTAPSDQPETQTGEKPDAQTGGSSGAQSGGDSAPSGGSADQSGSGTQGQSADKLETIDFTRSVVVQPAVEYDNLRLDVSSATSDENGQNPALLSGMKYDDKKYAVTVTDDGHFAPDRINEYQVSYELTGVSDGRHIADLKRYVWVTAKGAEFQAPPLTVDASKKYDLFSGIEYDSKKYDLSLVDPNAFDPENGETQRIMYRLTPRSDAPKEEASEQAAPSTDSGADSGKAADTDFNSDGKADAAGVQSQTVGANGQVLDDGDQETGAGGQTGGAEHQASDSYNSALAAAIFGRDVTVINGALLRIDAPPLIVTQGAVEGVSLLDGVKVTDGAGRPVKAQVRVADRGQLDAAAGEAADPSQADGKWNSPDSNRAASKDGQTEASGQPSGSVPSPAVLSATGRSANPLMSSFMVMPPSASDSSGNGIPKDDGAPKTSSDSAGTNASGTPAAFSAAISTPEAVGTPGAVSTSPAIHLSANDSLPADLPPGTYQVTLAAVNPQTREIVTQTRKVEVRANIYGPLGLYVKDHGAPLDQYRALARSNGNTPEEGWLSMASIFDYIGGRKSQSNDYAIQVVNGNNKQYFYSDADNKALAKLKGLDKDITITITGTSPDETDLRTIKPLMLNSDGKRIILPYAPDSAGAGQFVFKNISFANMQESVMLVANGSKLTIDSKVYTPNNGKPLMTLVGGAYNEAPDKLNTDLTVKSGSYLTIMGGSCNAVTKGSTKVTVDGVTMTTLIGGSGGTDLTQYQYNQVGDSDVTFRGNASVSKLFAGSLGDQEGATTLRIEGGNVGSTAIGGAAQNQTGNCDVTVTGGKIHALYGSSSADMGAGCSTVTVNGQGVSIDSLYGTNAVTQAGIVTVNLMNGTVNTELNVTSGSKLKNIEGNATVNITGGTVHGRLWGKGDVSPNSRKGKAFINLSVSQTVSEVSFFDQLNVNDGATLTVTGNMTSTISTSSYDGQVKLGRAANLCLNNGAANSAIGIATSGPGATVEVKRLSDQSKAPLNIEGLGTPNIKDPLTLKFIGKTGDNAVSGDQLVNFTKDPNAAAGALANGSYAAPQPDGYHNDLKLAAKGTKKGQDNGSSIVLMQQVGLQSDQPGDTMQFYGSVKAAIDAMSNPSANYTVSIRKENYALTGPDAVAIAGATGKAKSITFTSGITIQLGDPLENGEQPGDNKIRTVVLGSADPSAPAPKLVFSTDTVVEQMRLKFIQAGGQLFANGHSLTVGKGVQITSDQGYFPILYGGGAGNSVSSTNLHLSSGSFGGIYGGGLGIKSTVNGDVSIIIDGNGQLAGNLHGGGDQASVDGHVNIDIQGGELIHPKKGVDLGTPNCVIGGGKGTSATVGSCSISISGGTADGGVVVAGCDDQKVLGDVAINISKFGKDYGIHVPAANVYGGGLAGGTVDGNVTIQITDGKDYNVISGGGNPDFQWPQGTTAYNSASNKKIVTLSGNVAATDVVNFSDLNLGVTQTSKAANTASVKIDGTLDSNPAETSYGGRTGNLNFYSGSVLNLTGQKEPAVGYLYTEVSKNPSHLHISKSASTSTSTPTSYPMHVAHSNTSPRDAALVLGILSDSSGAAASGDRLLVFAEPITDVNSYRSDVFGLDLTLSEDKTTISFGTLTYPALESVRVAPRDAYGNDGSKGTIIKDVTFDMTSLKDDNITVASELTSAYVDTDESPDSSWKESGSTVNIGKDKVVTINKDKTKPGHWIGTIEIKDATEGGSPHYIHMRTDDGTVHTALLDLESPEITKSVQVSEDGEGNYTFTVTMIDPKLPVADTAKIAYTASGLYQTGWCVGTVSGPPTGATAAALSYPMDEKSGKIQGIEKIPDKEEFVERDVSFTVTPSMLAGRNLHDTVVFLFVKDRNGNTVQKSIPMSESQIAISLPLRAGIVAVKGGDSAQVEAPVCVVKNESASPVTAEIVGAEITTPKTGGLTFTDKNENFGPGEMNLQIAAVPTGGVEDPTKPPILAQSVAMKPFNTIELGTIAGKGSPQNYASFTFIAMFNQTDILLTSEWSTCKLSYRFTLKSSDPAAQAAASSSQSAH